MGPLATSVGVAEPASATEMMQGCDALHTILFEPNGPFTAVNWTVTVPPGFAVPVLMPRRLQSPAPVAAPLSAHSVTPNVLPGVKPVPTTVTAALAVKPSCGVIVTACAAPVGVGLGACVAGVLLLLPPLLLHAASPSNAAAASVVTTP